MGIVGGAMAFSMQGGKEKKEGLELSLQDQRGGQNQQWPQRSSFGRRPKRVTFGGAAQKARRNTLEAGRGQQLSADHDLFW